MVYVVGGVRLESRIAGGKGVGNLDLEDLSSPIFSSGRDVNGMLWKRVTYTCTRQRFDRPGLVQNCVFLSSRFRA
jgi:hypothetical protein